MQSDKGLASSSKSGYMVPWALPSSLPTDKAVKQLVRVLKNQGASSTTVSTPAPGASVVVATFKAGPLGSPLVTDTVEFVLADEHAAFRAAASDAPWPFSSTAAAASRNKARLLRVREGLFRKGWSCACPPDAGISCALACR